MSFAFCPLLFACLLIISVQAVGCRNVDVVTGSYATLDEACHEGALERGWIPEGLPPGTHDIREAHDLDSNRRWGLFSFRPEERGALKRLLKEDERAGAWDDLAAPIAQEAVEGFAERVQAAASPIDDVRGTAAYRLHALGVLARRALGWAAEERTEEAMVS